MNTFEYTMGPGMGGLSSWCRPMGAKFSKGIFLLRWTASKAGSGVPVMLWAVFTTLCSAFRSETAKLPDQTVMQLVRMLSMMQR